MAAIESPDQHPLQTASIQRHKKQVLLQIALPLILVGVGVLAILVLLILRAAGGPASANQAFADSAVVLLALPWMFGFLIILIISLAAIVGLSALHHKLPQWAGFLIKGFDSANQQMKSVTALSAQPLITLRQVAAKTNQVMNSLAIRLRKG